jgi:hypothetical protein
MPPKALNRPVSIRALPQKERKMKSRTPDYTKIPSQPSQLIISQPASRIQSENEKALKKA